MLTLAKIYLILAVFTSFFAYFHSIFAKNEPKTTYFEQLSQKHLLIPSFLLKILFSAVTGLLFPVIVLALVFSTISGYLAPPNGLFWVKITENGAFLGQKSSFSAVFLLKKRKKWSILVKNKDFSCRGVLCGESAGFYRFSVKNQIFSEIELKKSDFDKLVEKLSKKSLFWSILVKN